MKVKKQTERRPMFLVLRSVSYVLRRGMAYALRKESRSPSPSPSHGCQPHVSSASGTIVPMKYRPIPDPLRRLSIPAPPRRLRTAKHLHSLRAVAFTKGLHKRPFRRFSIDVPQERLHVWDPASPVVFAKSEIPSHEIRHPLPQMPYSDYNK